MKKRVELWSRSEESKKKGSDGRGNAKSIRIKGYSKVQPKRLATNLLINLSRYIDLPAGRRS
jgi:hypothetical protein